MQINSILQMVAISVIIAGIVFVILGILQSRKSSQDSEMKSESKGIILLGPIPIVWGFGDRGKILMMVLFIVIVSIYFVLYLL
ncbi:MAG: conserved membrane protein of unknown function [Candidatus Thorarchaeota archaeon]|nr:MAG: conserved membrane protein of unknown function [Candidatus Thorarchaeota archaeon]